MGMLEKEERGEVEAALSWSQSGQKRGARLERLKLMRWAGSESTALRVRPPPSRPTAAPADDKLNFRV